MILPLSKSALRTSSDCLNDAVVGLKTAPWLFRSSVGVMPPMAMSQPWAASEGSSQMPSKTSVGVNTTSTPQESAMLLTRSAS